jgi:ATP-dependent DNA helicase DinG
MTSSVFDAIKEKRNLLVEAGTGTGKSLAYLTAAVSSGRRTVVATATNQLSDQLFYKDLPSLTETCEQAGIEFTYASLKGRQNYLCLAKIAKLQQQDDVAEALELDGIEKSEPQQDSVKVQKARQLSDEINVLRTWSDSTNSGEITDAPATSPAAWQAVSVSSKQCPGAAACPFGDICFAELAKKKAKSANVVVTNHALLSQGASMSGDGGLEMLGSPEVLVVDEAHQLADSLTSALSFIVSEESVNAVIKEVSKASSMLGVAVNLAGLEQAADDFAESTFTLEKGRLTNKPDNFMAAVAGLIAKLMSARNSITGGLRNSKQEDKSKAQGEIALAAIDSAVVELNVLKEPEKPEFVQWADIGKDDKVLLHGAPLDVSSYFANMTDEVSALIATSATMRVGGSFDAIQEELGMQDSQTLDVGSPFAYNKQGILYVPDSSSYPAPVGADRSEHLEAIKHTNLKLIKAAGGRALCLFTTTRAAVETGEWLRERLADKNIDVLITGEASADHLVKEFRNNETSVLCATMGMWQGTDIPGNSCILVTIDKIPFPTPDDILNEARSKNASDQGRNGFYAVSVKSAAIRLAQGVGRLIRRGDDKGVVAILDSRLWTKPYGKTMLASLPDFVQMTDETKTTEALSRLSASLPVTVSNTERIANNNSVAGSIRAAKPKHKTPVSSAKTKSIGKKKT